MSAARLSDLLQRDLPVDPMIEGVTADSRKVRPGWLFAALPGANADGKRFVPAAVQLRRGGGDRRTTSCPGLPRRWSRCRIRAAPTPWRPPPSGVVSREPASR